MTTRTRDQSLFTTHSREKERARLARTFFTALSRSQSSFFYIALRSRGWFNNLFFPRKKRFFKNPFFLETNKTKTRASERVQNATRERESRAEKGERERKREKERKREHVPVDLRAVCLVRAILNDFLCRFLLFLRVSDVIEKKNKNLGCSFPSSCPKPKKS
jgi:hypothetical protein